MERALEIYKRERKLGELCHQFDIDLNDIDNHMVDVLMDSLAPSICMNNWCDYSAEYEPDQTAGFCEICDTNSCESILSLMGVI